MATIIFYKSIYGDYLDKLISYWTLGPFSHCEIYLSELELCFSCSPRENKTRFKKIDLSTNHWVSINIPTKINYMDCIKFLNYEYDWYGLINSQIFNNNKHDLNKLFCSELCAELCGFKNSNRYSPNSLYRYLLNHF